MEIIDKDDPVRVILRKMDNAFEEAKVKKMSRYDTEWGKWSRELNLVIRKRLAYPGCTPIFREVLVTLQLYWINRSQLLDIYYQNKWFDWAEKKRLNNIGKMLRDNITIPGYLRRK